MEVTFTIEESTEGYIASSADFHLCSRAETLEGLRSAIRKRVLNFFSNQSEPIRLLLIQNDKVEVEVVNVPTEQRWVEKDAWKALPGNRYRPEQLNHPEFFSAELNLDETFDVVVSL